MNLIDLHLLVRVADENKNGQFSVVIREGEMAAARRLAKAKYLTIDGDLCVMTRLGDTVIEHLIEELDSPTVTTHLGQKPW